MVTTRSLSGQHAEESKREETGSCSFANEMNGLLTFIAVSGKEIPKSQPARISANGPVQTRQDSHGIMLFALGYFRPLPLILATTPRFARMPSLRLTFDP
jgi:hypothetical protein